MKNTRDHYQALLKLGSIPEKMVMTHGCENLAEFVLHELCDESCLALHKVAFFLDNPDFNCFKGIVGISDQERFAHHDAWNNVTDFSQHMRGANFNQSTRSIARDSIAKNGTQWAKCAEDIAQTITVDDHGWYIFSAKHGNTGLIIFTPNALNDHMRMTLAAGASLLGLCPVF
jgi:hypothetical protein